MANRRSNSRRPGRLGRRAGRLTERHELAPNLGEPAGAIWGRRPVLEALAMGRPLRRVMIARGAAGAASEVRKQAAAGGVSVSFVDRAELDGLAFGGNHQGVAAILASEDRATLDSLLRADPAIAQPPIMLAADQVQDVGNLGSLIRTLEAVGGSGVVVPERRSAGLTGGLARASAGASLRTPVVQVANLERALQSLKARGVWLIGLDAEATADFETIDYNMPCCLVVGSESKGMRRLVRAACDAIVRVPMRGGVGSLNVAIAGAIVLYHVARSRADGLSHGG